MIEMVPSLKPIEATHPNSVVAKIGHPHERLIELISPLLAPLGYRIIDLEIQSHRQKTLRIFIDYLEGASESPSPGGGIPTENGLEKEQVGVRKIGIEDCVRVSRALDEPLDQIPEMGSFLNGPYELEVSSPGINRALRVAEDFKKFAGSRVRIHVYRPLTSEELSNASYQEANPKQKNFLGILTGFRESKVVLSLSLGEKKSKKKSKSQKGCKSKGNQKAQELKPPTEVLSNDSLPTNSEEEIGMAESGMKANTITIPLPLISKANLEPEFDFEASDERE